jgi:hypothetical protein
MAKFAHACLNKRKNQPQQPVVCLVYQLMEFFPHFYLFHKFQILFPLNVELFSCTCRLSAFRSQPGARENPGSRLTLPELVDEKFLLH